MRQRAEQLGELQVVVGQEGVFAAVERFEPPGVVVEVGRGFVGGRECAPVLVLPAFRVVEAHVAHRLAGAVGMADVGGEFHRAVRGEDPRAVALRAFDEVFAQIDDAPALRQMPEVLHRGEVCRRKDRHARAAPRGPASGSVHSPFRLMSSTRRSSASSCGMSRSTTSRPL